MRKKKQRTPEEQLEAAKVPREEWPYELPEGWTWVRLLSTFENQTDSKKKLKTKECLPAGKFPVIDQGKDFISGYTDREELVRSDDFPVVIFGDHTRYVKYVDFPFVQGADGIKVLKPAPLVDSRFFYYGLQTLPLPHLGYRRHFPLFKKFAFPLPPLAEQQRIVQRIEALFAKLDEAEEKLDKASETFAIREAAFLQMAFEGKLTVTCGKKESAEIFLQKVIEQRKRLLEGKKIKRMAIPSVGKDPAPYALPDHWKWCRLGEFVSFVNGDRGKNYPKRTEYVKQGVPWINAGHITEQGTLDLDSMNYISNEKFQELRSGKIQAGDLLYCLRGSFGKAASVEPLTMGAIASTLVIVRPILGDTKKFLLYYFRTTLAKMQLMQYMNGIAQPNLAGKDVAKFLIPIPPLDEQREIVRILDRLLARERRAKEAVAAARTHLKKLRASILARAFRGEL